MATPSNKEAIMAIKMECLRLAAAVSKDSEKGDSVVAKADLFYEFITDSPSIEIASTIPKLIHQ